MIPFALLVARKDLRLIFRNGGLAQALLLGLLLLFVFSMSRDPGQLVSPGEAAAIFWLSSAFCQILIFNQLYSLEENNSGRQALLLAPFPPHGIWLGKAISGFLLLLVAQAFFFPATIIFLDQKFAGDPLPGLAILFLGDTGICALGSLLGAAGAGQSSRESLLSIIIFPLLVPLLLAGISMGASALGAENQNSASWLGLAATFDAIFIAASLLLFGHLYRGED